MKAVYRKELSSFFITMTGYVFIAFFVAVVGMYFTLNNVISGNTNFGVALDSSLYVFLIAFPVLTMRSMAEERRTGTLQALLTAPVTTRGIIAGKFLALVTVFAIPVAIFAICPVIISSFGTWHPAADYAALCVYFLLGCACISVGLFISCLTDNQLIAAVGTFVVLLVIYLWDTIVSAIPLTPESSFVGLMAITLIAFVVIRKASGSTLAAGIVCGLCAVGEITAYIVKRQAFAGLLRKQLSHFSMTAALREIVNAKSFDLRVIILYAAVIVFFLFLSVRSIENRKWN